MHKPVVPVRGQRILFRQVNPPTNNTLAQEWQPLVRAEDPSVSYWQIVLSPVYRQQVGPESVAMPDLRNGAPQVRMTWGGGGVSFRIQFEYPVAGASFVVAGDNVQIDARALDAAAYTAAQLPAVSAWCAPLGAPTSAQPLVLLGLDQPGLFGPGTLLPFTRAIHVFTDTAGATAQVTFTGSLGTTTVHLPATALPARVPVPGNASQVTVTSSAGNLAVAFELAFT